MVTLNQLLMNSIYTAATEANKMTFKDKAEREKWEQNRSNEVFLELKTRYLNKNKN